jgi:hypothetical protein
VSVSRVLESVSELQALVLESVSQELVSVLGLLVLASVLVSRVLASVLVSRVLASV